MKLITHLTQLPGVSPEVSTHTFARRFCGSIAAALPIVFIVGALAILTACGSSGSGSSSSSTTTTSTSSTANMHPIVIDGQPLVGGVFTGAANALYTTVTVCVPGTSTCQLIYNIQVDTGSSGLRLVPSALGISLPQSTDAGGNGINECMHYSDGTFQWGAVLKADIQMEGEIAKAVPIQLMGGSNPPAACSAAAASDRISMAPHANGILGVGIRRQDCGAACASPTAGIPPVYFSCSSASSCAPVAMSLTNQLQNPVWMFPQDNDGVVIQLPSIPDQGTNQIGGSMTFGIGTQADNELGVGRIQVPDANGHISTMLNGISYPNSMIASGARANYFPASNIAGLVACTGTAPAGYYCPATELNLSAMNTDTTKNTISLAFNVANANTLFSYFLGMNRAFSNLAGPSTNTVVWGLPFFFGNTVFIAIEGQTVTTSNIGASTTTTTPGPFWAY